MLNIFVLNVGIKLLTCINVHQVRLNGEQLNQWMHCVVRLNKILILWLILSTERLLMGRKESNQTKHNTVETQKMSQHD